MEMASAQAAMQEKRTYTVQEVANIRGLRDDSIILLEQIRTVDKHRLGRHIGNLKENVMKEVNGALAVSVGIK